MDTKPFELSLVEAPALDAAARIFVAATRCIGVAFAASPPIAGPGWFDSSWELRCGLVVIEADDEGLLAWSLQMLQGQGVGGTEEWSLSAT